MWSVRSGVSVDSHGWVPVPVPDPVGDYRAMTHSSSVAEIAVAAVVAAAVVAAVVAAAVVGRHVWVTDLFLPYDYTHCQIQVQEQKKRKKKKKKKKRRKKERGGLGVTHLDPGVRQP